MFKYMSYLYANVRKKWSTYLIPLFGALVLVAMLLPSILTNKSDDAVIGNVTTFYYFLPFVFGAMFVGTKALNIFKDGEQDGTELLIVSKPISRGQIVLGKFATLYTLIIGYAIWSFITTMVIGFVDDNASVSQVMTFAGGYAIGSLIVMVIFSAIITFFASVMGKIGTMALSIVVPAILPIVSFILVPVGNGTPGEMGYTMTQYSTYKTEISADGRIKSIEKPEYIYDASNSQYSKQLTDKRAGFYKYVSYFDIWQHMFGFYSILKPQELTTSSQGVKVVDSNLVITGKDGIEMSNAAGEKFVFTPYGESSQTSIDRILVPSIMNQILDIIDTTNINTLITGDKYFEDLQDDITAEINEMSKNNPVAYQKLSVLMDGNPEYADKIIPFITAYEVNKAGVPVEFTRTDSNGNKETVIDNGENSGPNFRIFHEGQNLKTLEIKKYHSTGDIVAIYAVIAVVLSGLVIFRYYRRDFK